MGWARLTKRGGFSVDPPRWLSPVTCLSALIECNAGGQVVGCGCAKVRSVIQSVAMGMRRVARVIDWGREGATGHVSVPSSENKELHLPRSTFRIQRRAKEKRRRSTTPFLALCDLDAPEEGTKGLSCNFDRSPLSHIQLSPATPRFLSFQPNQSPSSTLLALL